MSSHRARRGFSLLDVMTASVVLTIGMLGVFALLQQVTGAQRSIDLTNTANAAFNQLSAQIRDARCEFDGSALARVNPIAAQTDPGLLQAVGQGWIGVAPPAFPNSVITMAGETTPDPGGARFNAFGLEATSPPLRIEYRVTREADPVLAGPGVAPAVPAPAFQVEIRIRQLTGDPAMDAPGLNQGWWIKHYMISKACNARYERGQRGRDGSQ